MKLLIDYEGLATNATRAAKALTTMLLRAGVEAIKVESDGRTKRIAGISYRELVFTFADSQSLALRIKATGDVYEVRVNGKVTPIKEQDDAKKAAAELAGLLDRTRAKFQKRMAAVLMKPPEGAKTAAPRLIETLRAQVAELDQQIEAATAELAELQAPAA